MNTILGDALKVQSLEFGAPSRELFLMHEHGALAHDSVPGKDDAWSNQAFNVIIAYENLAAGQRAVRLFSNLAGGITSTRRFVAAARWLANPLRTLRRAANASWSFSRRVISSTSSGSI